MDNLVLSLLSQSGKKNGALTELFECCFIWFTNSFSTEYVSVLNMSLSTERILSVLLYADDMVQLFITETGLKYLLMQYRTCSQREHVNII